VQAIEDLPLEAPLELGIVEIAGMQLEVVDVNRRVGEARPDNHLDRFALGAGVELDQRMLVESQLLLHALEARTHAAIVAETGLRVAIANSSRNASRNFHEQVIL